MIFAPYSAKTSIAYDSQQQAAREMTLYYILNLNIKRGSNLPIFIYFYIDGGGGEENLSSS